MLICFGRTREIDSYFNMDFRCERIGQSNVNLSDFRRILIGRQLFLKVGGYQNKIAFLSGSFLPLPLPFPSPPRNMSTSLSAYRNTVFICDTGNKSVRMLMSAKALIPLQKRFTFLNRHEHKALERTGKRNTNDLDLTIPRATRQSFLIVLESLTSLTNTMTETGHEHLLDRICFESKTTLSVECFFKGMRADHDMPTAANYAFRRARCVQDDMLRIYQKDISYFTGPNSFYPEKIIEGEPPNIKRRPSKQSQISEGTGSKEEDKRREAVMREFVGEYGKGVRQENVRSKTKELTGTLPYALSMRPSVITASSEDYHDVTTACQIEDANIVLQGRTVRVQTVHHIRMSLL